MCKVISVLNMKGGVGKTTLSYNIAEEISRYPINKKTLLIDLDPQSSLTQFALGEDNAIELHKDNKPTVYNLFSEEKVNINTLLHKITNNLYLIPSSLRLSKALTYAHDNVILGFNKCIKTIKRELDFDYIIIDCPPFESVFNRATYHVSDFILNPVTISKFSILGIVLLKESMDNFCDLYNAKINGGTVINAFDTNDNSINYFQLTNSIEEAIKELNADQFLEWSLFSTRILYSKSHKTSVYEGTCLRDTSYCRFDVKSNFSLFVKELIKKLNND